MPGSKDVDLRLKRHLFLAAIAASAIAASSLATSTLAAQSSPPLTAHTPIPRTGTEDGEIAQVTNSAFFKPLVRLLSPWQFYLADWLVYARAAKRTIRWSDPILTLWLYLAMLLLSAGLAAIPLFLPRALPWATILEGLTRLVGLAVLGPQNWLLGRHLKKRDAEQRALEIEFASAAPARRESILADIKTEVMATQSSGAACTSLAATLPPPPPPALALVRVPVLVPCCRFAAAPLPLPLAACPLCRILLTALLSHSIWRSSNSPGSRSSRWEGGMRLWPSTAS